MPHTKSELRTLLTKANEGLRIAKANIQSIEFIMNPLPRASEAYKTAKRCWEAVKATLDQEQAVVDNLHAEQQVVGDYKKKPKPPSAPVNSDNLAWADEKE